jgi:Leucine-rich repeat (LRR) protein
MGNLLGKDGIFSILSRKGDSKADPNLIPELVNIDPYSSRLDLKGRGIEFIPETITALKKLKWLNIPHNKLKELPDYLCQLSGLLTLRVLGNNISSLPPSFGKLSNLTCLDLGKNEFTEIQPLIGELQQLQELHLHWNKLSTVLFFDFELFSSIPISLVLRSFPFLFFDFFYSTLFFSQLLNIFHFYIRPHHLELCPVFLTRFVEFISFGL